MLVLLVAVATGAVAQSTYKVSVKEGTEDASSWTITPAEATTTGVAAGTEVKATYAGTKKVKSVKAVKKAPAAPAGKTVDLSTLNTDYVAQNGDVLTSTLGGNYKITIADGATVTLDGATINGENSEEYKWAGITCEGDAVIILKDGTTNTVKGFYEKYPGIFVPEGKKLTIQGTTGSLNVSSNFYGAGIGAGYANGLHCGNIEIQGGIIAATGGNGAAGIGGNCVTRCGTIIISGGEVTATGRSGGAGIGSGYGGASVCAGITISGGTVHATSFHSGAGIGSGHYGKCGDITISGGTVEATGRLHGGDFGGGPGIGSGKSGKCGDITITSSVTSLTATKGVDCDNSIGAGIEGTCGTITIGGTVTGYITTSPYTYEP